MVTRRRRRRELDISQRSLAADGIINARALIAFEKGRSWPRERTRAKLEEVLRWPPGTIARLRRGEPVRTDDAERVSGGDEMPLIAQAVVTAVNTFGSAIEPRATLGQRLYAARRGANLTILETAQAAGVSEETIVRAEAEEPVPAAAVHEIEALIKQIA